MALAFPWPETSLCEVLWKAQEERMACAIREMPEGCGQMAGEYVEAKRPFYQYIRQ